MTWSGSGAIRLFVVDLVSLTGSVGIFCAEQRGMGAAVWFLVYSLLLGAGSGVALVLL